MSWIMCGFVLHVHVSDELNTIIPSSRTLIVILLIPVLDVLFVFNKTANIGNHNNTG